MDDLFLGVNHMPTDSQSYHEGLVDTLTSPGQKEAEPHRRVSNPEPPSFAALQGQGREVLEIVSEDDEGAGALPPTHLVSHTQSLEDLRPRPLSHVFSVPAEQIEDHIIQQSVIPSLRWVELS